MSKSFDDERGHIQVDENGKRKRGRPRGSRKKYAPRKITRFGCRVEFHTFKALPNLKISCVKIFKTSETNTRVELILEDGSMVIV